jgi:hypothetical protein
MHWSVHDREVRPPPIRASPITGPEWSDRRERLQKTLGRLALYVATIVGKG